jgi:alpha-tubulin suppressor-like RCC1 family protein
MQMTKRIRAAVLKAVLMAGAGLCAAGMPALLAGSAASAVTQGSAASAVTHSSATRWSTTQSGATVDHWGLGIRSPEAVSGLPATPVEVGASNVSEYALLSNGQVWAWGAGARGELGDGGTANSSTPVQVQFPAGVTIASLPANEMPWDTGYAIDTNGNVWGWGANAGGEFCLGNTKSYLTPVELPFTDVTALAGADQHTTYDADGTLYSCGVNNYGQLGNGKTKSSHVPVKVQGLSGESVTSVVSGWNNVGVLYSNGQYYDWGFNAQGQLGDGTSGGFSDVPVQVQFPAAVTQVTQGGNDHLNGQSLAMLSNGSVYAWGANSEGQLGTGNLDSKSSPVQITPPSGVTYETLATGADTSYGITATGDVYSWGGNRNGQIGDGTTTPSKTPIKVLSQATQVVSATSTEIEVIVQG